MKAKQTMTFVQEAGVIEVYDKLTNRDTFINDAANEVGFLVDYDGITV